MLSKYFTNIGSLINKEFKPFPPIDDRQYWDRVTDSSKNSIIELANSFIDTKWPVLSLSLYRQYLEQGNRSAYEKLYFERRTALHAFFIAECLDNKGKYLDSIIDLIWMIVEETSWVIPAHSAIMGYSDFELRNRVADSENHTIDLFSAETAATLSIIYSILKTRLNDISPLICQRMYHEVEKRILNPYVNRTDFSFLGFIKGPYTQVNNWNPWINSNCMYAFLLIDHDEQRKNYALSKMLRSVNLYLSAYPEDGGCDEGPTYWSHSVASLFCFIELLYEASNGKVNIFTNVKIKKMGTYIVNTHIADNYFVNYADSHLINRTNPTLLYRYGNYINNDNMMALGQQLLATHKDYKQFIKNTELNRSIRGIMSVQDILSNQIVYEKTSSHYFNQIQVMTATCNQLFLSAKGGHNNESHNHNDVGNFIVYKDSLPFIIDTGNAIYTKKTFSNLRYDIWTNQSNYHNIPIINGNGQCNGSIYKANDVIYTNDSLSMDLSKAYHHETNINTFNRVVSLDRENSIVKVTDRISLDKNKNELLFILMTPYKPLISPGKISLIKEQTCMEIDYSNTLFDASYELITHNDSLLKIGFGDYLYRIILTYKCKQSLIEYTISFR